MRLLVISELIGSDWLTLKTMMPVELRKKY